MNFMTVKEGQVFLVSLPSCCNTPKRQTVPRPVLERFNQGPLRAQLLLQTYDFKRPKSFEFIVDYEYGHELRLRGGILKKEVLTVDFADPP